ncbi:MAG: tetratricopeptide repeat protein [Melioribacteraceae bacterium]|nr:tetratricopeptide repeat protein [Melioribacteraceae bacterium]
MAIKSKKVLSGFQVGVAIIILAAVAGFILISSGLFDSPTVPNTQHNHANDNKAPASPSVNLNAINEINKLENVLKSNPNNHEALLSLGHLLNDNGFYDRAIEKYETYLKDHPDNVDVIVDMGVCFFELKNYDKAINIIKSGIQIDPNHQIANFNLGIVNFANNNITEAKLWWEKANKINPNSNLGKKAEELLKSNK